MEDGFEFWICEVVDWFFCVVFYNVMLFFSGDFVIVMICDGIFVLNGEGCVVCYFGVDGRLVFNFFVDFEGGLWVI